MASTQVLNYLPSTTTNVWSVVWRLTRALVESGWNLIASGNNLDSGFDQISSANALDEWISPGSITVNESDYWFKTSGTTYVSTLEANTAWCVLRSPAITHYFTIGAPTGSFIPGEKVTTAEGDGEIIGYSTDGAGNHALAVHRRTGTFTGTSVITGVLSGATATPTTTVRYIEEWMFAKAANTTQGTIYKSRRATTESSFLSLTRSATVPPGTAVTELATLAAGVALAGTGGVNTPVNWVGLTSALTRAHIMVADGVATSDYTPDGSFVLLLSNGTNVAIWTTQICNRTGSLDLDPYVQYMSASAVITQGGPNSMATTGQSINALDSSGRWFAWRNRGLSSGDVFTAATWYTSFTAYSGGSLAITVNFATPENAAYELGTKRLLERATIASATASAKHRKGECRWIAQIYGGLLGDTWASKTWVQTLAPSTTANPGIMWGMWDGSTTPIF